MASEHDAEAIETYAKAIGGAWPDISAEKRERLAVLFSGPWLDDDDDPAAVSTEAAS